MKMVSFSKNKKKSYILIVLILVVFVGGGYYFFQKRDNKNTETNNNNRNQKQQVNDNLQGKEAIINQTQQDNASTSQDQEPPSSITLNDVSIQAIKSSDGSVSLSLYGPQGSFDVEKCFTYLSGQCQSGWMAKLINKSYSGHGGLPIDTMGINEKKAVYMVYLVSAGKRVSSSKPITVESDAVVDTKTFIGG